VFAESGIKNDRSYHADVTTAFSFKASTREVPTKAYPKMFRIWGLGVSGVKEIFTDRNEVKARDTIRIIFE
jgi:hypothetical protein